MDLVGVLQAQKQKTAAGIPAGDQGIIVALHDDEDGKVDVNCNGFVETVWLPLEVDLAAVGDTVIVQRNGSFSYVAGRLKNSVNVPRVAIVEVANPGAIKITVSNTTGQMFTLPFLSTYTPVVGDLVRVTWEGGFGTVLGKILSPANTAPTRPITQDLPQPPSAPSPPPSSGSSTFPAVDARSFRNGKWRTDSAVVAQGSYGSYGENFGAWFYGNGPKASLAGATVTGCSIRVSRLSGGDYAPQTVHLYTHSSATRPSADVTRVDGPTNADVARFDSPWISLPAAWGQKMVDLGYGIAINGSPYINLSGLDSDSQSGLVRIDWSR